MSTFNKPLLPEDYCESCCPMDMRTGAEKNITPVPVDRILEKLDEYFERNDYTSAERHLLYWLEEAGFGRDLRGEYSLRNELMGLYRKIGREDQAIENGERTLELIKTLEYENSVTGATGYLNFGTVCTAFRRPERALELFSAARAIYERQLKPGDRRLGGLYNNMANCLRSLKRWDEAFEMFNQALSVMNEQPQGEPEQAITWLNMANTLEDAYGMEEAAEQIEECVDKAIELLDTKGLPRNGYYAFVCDKCAPAIDYYGHFAFAAELRERVKTIYERP